VIAFVQGNIVETEASHVVIDCNGIGYFIKISLNTYSAIRDNKSIRLYTHFMVREDNQQLYGFAEKPERQLFEQLISISGVGGNTALMILSSMSAEELFDAIRREDSLALKRVKGIGAKTAGRIILELKDKIKLEEGTTGSPTPSASSLESKKQEAITALTNLGLNKTAMNQRVEKILKEQGSDVTVEQIIKLALRNPG
jgi:Holliday junction DNA helicase RuvA